MEEKGREAKGGKRGEGREAKGGREGKRRKGRKGRKGSKGREGKGGKKGKGGKGRAGKGPGASACQRGLCSSHALTHRTHHFASDAPTCVCFCFVS